MRQFWLDSSKLTDGEFADLLHQLTNEFEERLKKYRGLSGQLDKASLTVRSWSTSHQRNMKAQL